VTSPRVSPTPSSRAGIPGAAPSARHTAAQPARRLTHVAPPVATRSAAQPPPAPVSTGLPLALPTGTATQVITVVAPSTGSTTATLQAWQKSGAGWSRHGPSVGAHVGSAGLTAHPSESRSATPIGSFTLTQAFGRDPNPGTSLPYTRTTPADWWISQPSPLYNTRQRCSGQCPFTQGAPNEHLYYTTPFYFYAVVIDYNTAHPVPGAGSAIFLHVTDGNPTAACVAIPQDDLTSIMRWLAPSAHPRILIGIGS
jgi:L,D-peptidoglycan transpeptidase YkuD (ErfK/YbiS/YcfS/YnhG family)